MTKPITTDDIAYTGDCVIRRTDEGPEIVCADDHVRFSVELLNMISDDDDNASLIEQRIILHGTNRTVTYRVDGTDALDATVLNLTLVNA